MVLIFGGFLSSMFHFSSHGIEQKLIESSDCRFTDLVLSVLVLHLPGQKYLLPYISKSVAGIAFQRK